MQYTKITYRCSTLSPMGSFTSELGVQFEACMEAPHVVNVDSQVRLLKFHVMNMLVLY
jgi:hypothetical protein